MFPTHRTIMIDRTNSIEQQFSVNLSRKSIHGSSMNNRIFPTLRNILLLLCLPLLQIISHSIELYGFRKTYKLLFFSGNTSIIEDTTGSVAAVSIANTTNAPSPRDISPICRSRRDDKSTLPANAELSVKSVCQCIPYWTRRSGGQTTINSIWNTNFVQNKIREAALVSLKECWHWPGALDNLDPAAFANLTDRMLRLLDIHRLKKSAKTIAHPFVLERLLQVILQRIEDPLNNSPVRIAVFGGSVTEGVRSSANSLNLQELMKDRTKCTWSCKLERLLNHILVRDDHFNSTSSSVKQHKIFEVKNFAVSGTDSSIGFTLLEYNLFGADMSKIDIFIAAFAANDLQAPSGFDRDRMFVTMQQFLRLAKSQRPCSDLPLVIQVDDVLFEGRGKMAREVLRSIREMVETNSWAGFMSLSYPEAVRDVVYANPSDTTLHELEELHPGYTFHTGMAWMIAFHLLHGLLEACDATSLPGHSNVEPRNGFPLPILHDDLSAPDVPVLWKKQSEHQSELCAQNTTGTICEYQYIAHRLGAGTREKVQETISKVSSHIDGWEAIGFSIRKPRRTWKAMGPNATFTIQLDNISIPVNRILVLYLKSYGKDWEGTKLEIVIEGRASDTSNSTWVELKRVELSGAHNAKTSISYSEHIDLGKNYVAPGSSIRVKFTVIQGHQFQINGLALCQSDHSMEEFRQ